MFFVIGFIYRYVLYIGCIIVILFVYMVLIFLVLLIEELILFYFKFFLDGRLKVDFFSLRNVYVLF